MTGFDKPERPFRGRSEANANVNVSAYLPEGSAQWKQWLSSKRHLFGTGWLDESVFDAAGLLGADIDD